jgi:hypothetical protein
MDVTRALLGKKFCGWCNDIPATWYERLMRFDQLVKAEDRRWYENIANAVSDFNTEKLRWWRIGQWWHHRFHIPTDDPRKLKVKWAESINVGDQVCDCRGKHITVAAKDGDDITSDDGSRCSLFRCCSPIEADGGCHTAWQSVEEMYE